MTIKEQLEKLSKERDDARAEATKMLADGEAEGLSEDVLARVDELTDGAKAADEQIKALLDKENQIKTRLEALNSFADHSAAISNARGVHPPAAPQEPSMDTKIPARVRRFGNLQNFKGDINGIRAEERAYRFGQFAMAKLSMDLPTKFRFQHAMQFAADQFGMSQPLAVHGEGGSDTTGSHVFVPDEFGSDLIVLRNQFGVGRRVLNVVPMSSDTKSEPRWVSGLTAYFVGENSAGTESDSQWDSVSLTAKKLMALTRMSKELDEDSVINFGDRLAGEISYAFASKEDDCVFNGDGTSTYGGMTGIRNRLDTLTAGTAPGLILGDGNAWSELTLANFEEVVGALPEYADVPGQVAWICHKTFAWTVMKKLALAAGGNTKDDIEGSGGAMVFLGYPVITSNKYPSAEANSQIPVTFGNYRLGGMLGDRRMESIEFSDSVSVGGQSVWERDQIAVKGTERFDVNIHDFGSDTEAGPICGLETASS